MSVVRHGVPPIGLIDDERLVSLFEQYELGPKPKSAHELVPEFMRSFASQAPTLGCQTLTASTVNSGRPTRVVRLRSVQHHALRGDRSLRAMHRGHVHAASQVRNIHGGP